MTTTPRGSPELATSQAVPETTVNEQIRRTEAGACHFPIVNQTTTAPPGSCADGANYIIAATATGAWTGKEKQIATAVGTNAASGWYYHTPVEGFTAYDQTANARYLYGGSTWALDTTGGGGGTASTLDYDTDGTLAANSDAKIATQKATKTYVDGKVAGLSWKQAVRVATTANGTLVSAFENGDTVDGVTLATGDRILLKNQSTAAENGIYVVAASGAPARATDADSGAELVNASVYVSEGTANADTQWTCTTNATITPGSTSLAFAQLTAGGGTITALTGDVTASGSGSVAATVANANYSATLTATGTPPTNAIGYLGAPQNILAGSYTTLMTDAGKHFYHTSGSAHTLTIDSNANVAYPIGTVMAGVNENGAGVLTISITSDTLRWGSSTGSRSVAANGTFSLVKVTSTVWRLTGDGIT